MYYSGEGYLDVPCTMEHHEQQWRKWASHSDITKYRTSFWNLQKDKIALFWHKTCRQLSYTSKDEENSYVLRKHWPKVSIKDDCWMPQSELREISYQKPMVWHKEDCLQGVPLDFGVRMHYNDEWNKIARSRCATCMCSHKMKIIGITSAVSRSMHICAARFFISC